MTRREGVREGGKEGGREGESEGVRDSILLAEMHDYLCIGQKHTHLRNTILPSEF